MKTLLLVRHAKSEQKSYKGKERNRPITKRGARLAKSTAVLMRAKGIIPQFILASPAKKSVQTVEIIARETGFSGKIKYREALYMAEADGLLKVLRKLDDEFECVLIVGHNPGLESLIPTLTHEIAALPHAGLAWLCLPVDSWGEVTESTLAQLVEVWDPHKDEAEGAVQAELQEA